MNINEPFNFDTLLITKSGAVNPRVVQSCAFATPSESEFFCTVKSRPISYSISLFHSLRSTLIFFWGAWALQFVLHQYPGDWYLSNVAAFHHHVEHFGGAEKDLVAHFQSAAFRSHRCTSMATGPGPKEAISLPE